MNENKQCHRDIFNLYVDRYQFSDTYTIYQNMSYVTQVIYFGIQILTKKNQKTLCHYIWGQNKFQIQRHHVDDNHNYVNTMAKTDATQWN